MCAILFAAVATVGCTRAEAGVGMIDSETTLAELERNSGDSISGVPEPEAFSAPKPVRYTGYTVAKGDMIGNLAERYGLNQDTILSVNGIRNSRLVQIGQRLAIPNQDGILYECRTGDTLEGIASSYQISAEAITVANGLLAPPVNGQALFLPAARLSRTALQEINGDLFIWPVRGYISSYYGYRTSPFTGKRQFHSGLDIAAPLGTPIRAGMAGRVTTTGYDVNSGNYVVISHHSGYRTFYGHMDVIRVKAGQTVSVGQRIGDVGSTGLSTGSHVHFTVYKNGVTKNPLVLIN